MGKDYDNFYENMGECQYRLNNTVIMYDSEPYFVLAITPRAGDRIFRVYLLPLDQTFAFMHEGTRGLYPHNYPNGSAEQGAHIDEFMDTDQGKKMGILRKHINSPKFNKFRPFPLGMINKGGSVYYLERIPQRHREQGLTGNHIQSTPVNLGPQDGLNVPQRGAFRPYGSEMLQCIKGEHPSLRECIEQFRDPEIVNTAVAFHRDCALIKGPLNLLFLSVKASVVGLVTEDRRATLERNFRYLKEMVEDTNSFIEVKVKA